MATPDRQAQTVKVVTVSPAVKAVAGSLGGIVEACLLQASAGSGCAEAGSGCSVFTPGCALQPVDVVKTRLQLDKGGAYRGGCSPPPARPSRGARSAGL